MTGERAIIYCRVSSEKQAGDDKTSLATQEAECRKACAERGYTVVGVFKGVIPRSTLDRPQLNRVRELIRDRRAEVLMAMVVDRLSGDQKNLYVLMDEVERHKARLEFAREVFEQTATGGFLLHVKSFVAELELERNSGRILDGNTAKKEKGEPLGVIPLGFAKDGHHAKIDPLRAPTIRRIFHLYADEHLSLRKLGAVLKAEGHTTGRGKPKFSPSALNRIIENPKYRGAWPSNQWRTIRERGQKPRFELKPESEWIWHEWPKLVIIEPDLWHRANRIRRAARASSPRRVGDPEKFLLRSGHIRCGTCKSPMHGITPKAGSERAPYYTCDSQRREKGDCTGVYISTRIVDPAAWSICLEVLDDPDVLLEWGLVQAEDGSLDEPIARARAEAKAAGDEVDRLGARALIVSEDLVPKVIDARQSALALKAGAERELAELLAQAGERERLAGFRDSLATWQAEARTRLHELTHQEKRDVLQDLGIMVTVYPDGHKPRWDLGMSVDVQMFGPQALAPGFYDAFKTPDWAETSDSVAEPWALLSATPRA